jgi:predicted nucleic acid-binding protein
VRVVVDASALVYAVLGVTGGSSLRERLAAEECHAPHLIDAELGNVLRRRVLRGELTADDALVLLVGGAQLIDHRHAGHGALAHAAWVRRANLSFYDGLYAALAAALSAPLLTADTRLARSPGLDCTVEQVGG